VPLAAAEDRAKSPYIMTRLKGKLESTQSIALQYART